MTERVYNFSPGPAALPLPALQQAQETFLAIPGLGVSPLEVSHRSKWALGVFEKLEANLRELYALPDNFKVLFLQGGATMQFTQVPLNFLKADGPAADYILTGSWGSKAIKEAKKVGPVNTAWNGKEDNFNRIPANSELSLTAGAPYVHFTSNETIQGVQFQSEPETNGVPLVCDASSDFISRPLDFSKYGIIYAGAQKNAGPAGVTVVLIRDDMLAKVPENQHAIMDYKLYADNGSMYNTPPVFAVYMVQLVTNWLLEEVGGLAKIDEINTRKAGMLYDAIDQSNGFYKGHAVADCRSKMNVTWRLPSEELEAEFIKQAAERNLSSLKGHRSVGGIRASIYNAMPEEGVACLRDFMLEFMKNKA